MWHFTFGQGSPLRDHYVTVVTGDYDEAREAIHETFKDRWAFQYDDAAIKEIEARHSTKRIFTIVRHPFNNQWVIANGPH